MLQTNLVESDWCIRGSPCHIVDSLQQARVSFAEGPGTEVF